MSIIELFIIITFCSLQSIFGVGLLLLGTPTFLFLGYEFFEVLNILLPYSIIISFLQILTSQNKDLKFGKKIFFFSIPSLIFGLILVNFIQYEINYILVVSIFLVIFSLINIVKIYKKKLKIKRINIFLVILGFIHGLTNLGGTLLALIVSNLDNIKDNIRLKIAYGYLIFAIFQLLFINIFFMKMNFIYLKYIWIPFIIYLISQEIYKKMDNVLFYKLLNFLALIYGIFIFFNSFL